MKQSKVMLEARQSRRLKAQTKGSKGNKTGVKKTSKSSKIIEKPITPQVISKFEGYFGFSNLAWNTKSHIVSLSVNYLIF